MKTSLLKQVGAILVCLLASSGSLLAQNLNLALAKTTTASSMESSSYPGANANDGDHNTRWSSEFSDNQYLVINLGSVQTIDRIRLSWETAYGSSFLLQVSNDALTWNTVQTVTSNNPVERNGQFINEFSNLNRNGTSIGQYVRMLGQTRNTTYGYSIYEFEVYSFSNAATSVAMGKQGTASNTESNYAPSLAFDGDDNTRWSTLSGTDQSLVVDLGQTANISRVYLNWEQAYGVNFLLQVSSDASSWVTFATFANNQVFYNEMAVAASGRYVRMYGQHGAQNNGGFSIYELKLFGSFVPLPVSLVSFAAAPQGTGVAVGWTTATELNNSGFEVQRSANGADFTTLAKVAGAGNSQIIKSYRYLDALPLRGTSYYRLKQNDLDGTVAYGPVVAVQTDGVASAGASASVSLYPNPVADLATVQWLAPTASAGHWTLYTTTGQLVHQEKFEVQPGANSQAIDLRAYAAGSYVLTVETAGQTLHRQLVQKQ